MKISILVTTYKRPEHLKNCIDSLIKQSKKPDEIIIVSKEYDLETDNVFKSIINDDNKDISIKYVKVKKTGIVVANNEGLKYVSGEILCFIDDDAVAMPGWLEKIDYWFSSNPSIGAVGGSEIVYNEDGSIIKGFTDVVGKITWYGEAIGNFYLECNKKGYVDFLKGCNMSFRRNILEKCDEIIAGDSSYYELDLCFLVKKKGFKIFFDNELIVKHFYGPRYLPGGRNIYSRERVYWDCHNKVYVMMKNLHFLKKPVFIIYFFIFDSLKNFIKSILRGNSDIIKYNIAGKIGGLISFYRKK